ncbi:hypothetical protein ACVBEJ_14335 [Porticoccus sp. GXU_MW_L64]
MKFCTLGSKGMFFCQRKAVGVFMVSVALLQNACAGTEQDGLRAMAGESEKVVKLVMGRDEYAIPVSYLTPDGDDYPDEIVVTKGRINIGVSLPSYRGYSKGDSLVGEYNPAIVKFSWQESGVGIENDADKRLSNALEYGLVQRDPSKDVLGMAAYSSLYDEGTINYISEASHGSKVKIECYTGSVNELCKMHYFHKQKSFGVTAVFDHRYLKEWKSIDEKINALLSSWEMRKEI